MHPDIKTFLEKKGKIRKMTEPSGGWTNVPFYFLDQEGTTRSDLIAAPFGTIITYYLGDNWYFEEEAIKVIKLKAFL